VKGKTNNIRNTKRVIQIHINVTTLISRNNRWTERSLYGLVNTAPGIHE